MARNWPSLGRVITIPMSSRSAGSARSNDLRSHITGYIAIPAQKEDSCWKQAFQGTAMPEYIQAIERYLLDNPKLSKPALVELLTKRFSNLSADEAWIIVSRYFNKKA